LVEKKIKETWLNSKAPPPDWVVWTMLFCFFLGILAIVSGFIKFTLIFSLIILIIIFICYLIGPPYFRNKEFINKVGKEIYEKVSANLTLVRIIECDILNVCGGKSPRMHLQPPGFNYTGKEKQFWDIDKKLIRYETSFKNGQEHGNWCGWYQNGQLGYQQEYISNGIYSSGKIHGETQVWDKSGTLLATLHYNEGKIIYK